MTLFIATIVFAILLLGFLLLTSSEKKSGKRFLGSLRDALDERITHTVDLIRELKPLTLIVTGVRVAFDHVVHEIVHIVLLGIRLLERLLTRLARELRGRRASADGPHKPFLSGVERIRRVLGSKRKREESLE